jgi:hypothetical protein
MRVNGHLVFYITIKNAVVGTPLHAAEKSVEAWSKEATND